ncbi:hypothetical protein SETIT_6G147200v2 [Setaria italica]|uniref:Myb/SANT-like domain-containing protein n=1 Tax=Setaria italica TaxID=4555 RepID=A0A368RLN7_SETIT|nr:hypothetical protein SETIT_6G147200v2 [Setaria italica]
MRPRWGSPLGSLMKLLLLSMEQLPSPLPPEVLLPEHRALERCQKEPPLEKKRRSDRGMALGSFGDKGKVPREEEGARAEEERRELEDEMRGELLFKGCQKRGKQRADWNPTLEKSLVEILHEYKDSGYRSDNGWNTKGWNKMVKEFHLRNKSVSYTKVQIQDKECQLKRDYKMLKAARMQSGSKWNEQRNMVEGSTTFPKIKKFQNNKASFSLFDALGELYDGHLVEGTYNFTSIESQRVEEPLHQIDDVEDDAQAEKEALQEIHEIRNEEDEEKDARDEEEARTRENEARENKTREKGARDKEADEYSIKRYISIINTMEVTKQEKAKAYAVFTKSKENRETFICASEEDEESTLIWLRNEMA